MVLTHCTPSSTPEQALGVQQGLPSNTGNQEHMS